MKLSNFFVTLVFLVPTIASAQIGEISSGLITVDDKGIIELKNGVAIDLSDLGFVSATGGTLHDLDGNTPIFILKDAEVVKGGISIHSESLTIFPAIETMTSPGPIIIHNEGIAKRLVVEWSCLGGFLYRNGVNTNSNSACVGGNFEAYCVGAHNNVQIRVKASCSQ